MTDRRSTTNKRMPSSKRRGHPSDHARMPANECAPRCILTINGGSSSIKFAIYPYANSERDSTPLLVGGIDRIGTSGALLACADSQGHRFKQLLIRSRDHRGAAKELASFLRAHITPQSLVAVGHRVVHGGTQLRDHTVITKRVVAKLKGSIPLDLAHLPEEIMLIETMAREFPATVGVACLDTAFHRNMPVVAQQLPIPRRFMRQGIRRFGFHGLSYSYLMESLIHLAPDKAHGRIILAHLGSGASMAAVKAGQAMDTTMSFTPTAGLVMATRPGDMDPGLLVHLMRQIPLTPTAADRFINQNCGLRGVSGHSGDMRELHRLAGKNPACRDAINFFCYSSQKTIGSLAAGMGGLDVLVFSGGIGENDALVREEICRGLEFLGITLNVRANARAAPIISRHSSRVLVRIIATDEQQMIARIVRQLVTDGGISM